MSKVTLTNLVNLQNETTAVNAINANNAVITTAMDKTLSRDGTAPNTMLATLDMNSHRIINLPVADSGDQPVRKAEFDLIANTTPTSKTFLGTNQEINIATNASTLTWSLPSTLNFTGKTIIGGTFPTPSLTGVPDANSRKFVADALGIFNAGDYGVNVGSADNATALNALIVTVNALGGGIINLPQGTLVFQNPIVMNFCQNVILRGTAGPAMGTVATTFIYGGLGASFIQMNSALSCKLEKLTIYSNNAGFTGCLAICQTAVSNPAFCKFEDCVFGSLSSNLVVGINLDNAVQVSVERCDFGSLYISLYGVSTPGNYSGVITVRECQFVNSKSLVYIYSPGDWLIDRCVFENNAAGQSCGIQTPPGLPSVNVTITNNWFGDSTVAGGVCCDLVGGNVTVTGNYISGAVGGIGVSLNNTQSAVIKGNLLYGFTTCIYFVGTNVSVDIEPNQYLATINIYGGVLPPGYGSWHNLPNGMIMEYGSAVVTTGVTLPVVFPKAMSVAPVSIQCTQKDATGAANLVQVVGTPTTTGFSLSVLGAAGNETVYWTAIGYIH